MHTVFATNATRESSILTLIKKVIDVVYRWMSECICFIQLIDSKTEPCHESTPVDAPILYLSSCSMDETPEVSRRNAEATF
jgi:hypothetical protein